MKLKHPDTGHVVHVGPTGAETMRARGYEPLDGQADAPAAGPAAAPAKSAPRGEWDEHARSVGLDPGEFSSKDDLIAAVESR